MVCKKKFVTLFCTSTHKDLHFQQILKQMTMTYSLILLIYLFLCDLTSTKKIRKVLQKLEIIIQKITRIAQDYFEKKSIQTKKSHIIFFWCKMRNALKNCKMCNLKENPRKINKKLKTTTTHPRPNCLQYTEVHIILKQMGVKL